MARRGAARREKRVAKREAAKESRGGQKYKNQKGGITKPEHKRGKRGKGKGRGPAAEEEDGEVRHRPDAPLSTPRSSS